MSHAAFLDAIRAEPHDDTHRLVYADWLDDHGDADRAEFIRVQCRLAHLDRFAPERDDLERRERELLARHERTWLGDVAGVSFMTVRRGFLSDVMLPVGVFLPGWRCHT